MLEGSFHLFLLLALSFQLLVPQHLYSDILVIMFYSSASISTVKLCLVIYAMFLGLTMTCFLFLFFHSLIMFPDHSLLSIWHADPYLKF